MKYFYLLTAVLLLGSFNVVAGTSIATSSKIIEVYSITEHNKDGFLIRVKGGEGKCVDGTWIRFPLSDSPSREAHNRSYQTLLNAFHTGTKVSVHNFVDDSCNHASQVSMRK